MSRIRKVKNTITKKFSRASLKITRLQNHLNNIKDKMKKITNYNLEKVLQSSNIPNSQSDLIHEIFKAAKLKNPKNRKYSENWLLLCMLFQIRYNLTNSIYIIMLKELQFLISDLQVVINF